MPSPVSGVQDLANFAATKHVIGKVRGHGETKDGCLQRYTQVRLVPSQAVMAADEKGAPVSIEIISRRQIERFGVARSVSEHPAVRTDRTQARSFQIAPVQSAIDTTKGSKTRGNGQLTRLFRIHHHRVNVDRALIGVEAVNDVYPTLAAIEATEQPTYLKAGVDLIRMNRI